MTASLVVARHFRIRPRSFIYLPSPKLSSMAFRSLASCLATRRCSASSSPYAGRPSA